jgi:hypothetical protein
MALDSQCRVYEDSCLVRYNAVQFVEIQLTFRRNMSPPKCPLTFNGLSGVALKEIEVFVILSDACLFLIVFVLAFLCYCCCSRLRSLCMLTL